MVLRNNFFIEKILPGAILRTLSDEKWRTTDGRSPSLARGDGFDPDVKIPIEGEPADVVAIVTAYDEWLKASGVPKLFLKAEAAGYSAARMSTSPVVCQRSGGHSAGVHFVQEDSPHEIGRAIAGWLGALG